MANAVKSKKDKEEHDKGLKNRNLPAKPDYVQIALDAQCTDLPVYLAAFKETKNWERGSGKAIRRKEGAYYFPAYEQDYGRGTCKGQLLYVVTG